MTVEFDPCNSCRGGASDYCQDIHVKTADTIIDFVCDAVDRQRDFGATDASLFKKEGENIREIYSHFFADLVALNCARTEKELWLVIYEHVGMSVDMQE